MRIGWDPMMCVADNLLCNGFPNCPKSSTTSDEDEKLCKKSFFAPTSLEQLAVELFKKWKPPDLNNKWLHEKLDNASPTPPPRKPFISWREWQDVKKTESEYLGVWQFEGVDPGLLQARPRLLRNKPRPKNRPKLQIPSHKCCLSMDRGGI